MSNLTERRWLEKKLREKGLMHLFRTNVKKKKSTVDFVFKNLYIFVANPNWTDEEQKELKERMKMSGSKVVKLKIMYNDDNSFDKRLKSIYSTIAQAELKQQKKDRKSQFHKKKFTECCTENCNVKFNLHPVNINNKNKVLCTKCKAQYDKIKHRL